MSENKCLYITVNVKGCVNKHDLHPHTTNHERGNRDQVQNINMTLFHNPKKRSAIRIRNAKFSLFSSLNWIYFQQRTVIQFQNKQDHPLSKHH